MLRTPVKSSNLQSIGYDLETQTLEIEFKFGKVYQYYNVPNPIYLALMNALSHGTYFHKYIKGTYSYRRIQ